MWTTEQDIPADFQIDWTYLAGWFDGEGCAGIYPNSNNYPRTMLIFTSTDEIVMRLISEFLQANNVKANIHINGSHNAINHNWSTSYGIEVTRKLDVKFIAKKLIPLCITKRKALTEVFKFLTGEEPIAEEW